MAQGHEVRLIEHRREVLVRIHHELPTEVIYEGDAADPEVLRAAGIARRRAGRRAPPRTPTTWRCATWPASATTSPRTIARVNNPRNAWLFDKTFHVDVALNQADILSSLIEEEMSLGDMMTLLKLRRGHYSLVDEKIPAGAKAIGVAIKDLKMPAQNA